MVTVEGGVVTEVVYADDADEEFTPGDAPNDDIKERVPSVDGLFDKIQGGIDQSAFAITVTYGEVYGNPTSIYIDYDEMIADEELHVFAGDPIPLTGSPTPSPSTSPSSAPSNMPSANPTAAPSPKPTFKIDSGFSSSTTSSPTSGPTSGPSSEPTLSAAFVYKSSNIKAILFGMLIATAIFT